MSKLPRCEGDLPAPLCHQRCRGIIRPRAIFGINLEKWFLSQDRQEVGRDKCTFLSPERQKVGEIEKLLGRQI